MFPRHMLLLPCPRRGFLCSSGRLFAEVSRGTRQLGAMATDKLAALAIRGAEETSARAFVFGTGEDLLCCTRTLLIFLDCDYF